RSIPDEESAFCAEKNIHPIASERMDSIVNNTVERRERFHGSVAHSDHPTASTSDLPDCRNQPKDIAVAMCVRALVLRGEARLTGMYPYKPRFTGDPHLYQSNPSSFP